MKELAEKGFFAGLGLAVLTKEKIEQLAKDFAARAKISEVQGRKLADYLHEEGKKAREDLGNTVDGMVQSAMKRLPCEKKLAALEARVAALEAALAEQKPAAKAE
jgi:polyhydroxyalkanoate synthesis regulator phasin